MDPHRTKEKEKRDAPVQKKPDKTTDDGVRGGDSMRQSKAGSKRKTQKERRATLKMRRLKRGKIGRRHSNATRRRGGRQNGERMALRLGAAHRGKHMIRTAFANSTPQEMWDASAKNPGTLGAAPGVRYNK